MDHPRFSALRRSVSTLLSRRQLSSAIAGALATAGLALPGLVAPTGTAAKGRKKKQKCVATNKTCSKNRKAKNACKRCCTRSFITQGKSRRCMCRAEGMACKDTKECCGGTCTTGICKAITNYVADLEWGTNATPPDEPGEFSAVGGVAVAPSGSVYATDASNYARVQQFTRGGAFIRTWGGPGNAPGEFIYPYAVAVAASGKVYVADSDNKRVQIFSGSGKRLQIWNTATLNPSSGDVRPQDIAVTARGNIVMVHLNDNNDYFIAQYAPNGARQWTTSVLTMVHFLAIGPDDVVYALPVAASEPVIRFDREGTNIAPNIYLSDISSATYGAATDRAGNLYAAGGSSIRKFSPDGTWMATITSGPPIGELDGAERLAVTADGLIYVTVTHQNRIVRFTPQ